MSDASSIASLVTQTITANVRAQVNAKAEIIRLAAELQNLKQAEALRGQIINISENGQITIKTERGEVVIRADQLQNIQTGSQVEIRIDAGSPPETALVKPYKATTTNVQQQAKAQETAGYTLKNTLPLQQAIPLSEVINGIDLEVKPYTASQGLNAPFLTEVQSRVTPLSAIQIPSAQTGAFSVTAPESAPFQLSLSTPLYPIEGQADVTISPLTQNLTTPFRSIAPQILSQPLQEPITDADITQISTLRSIKIEKITTPEPKLSGEAIDRVSTLNAPITTTQAILTGFTQSQNFAVLRIESPARLSDQQYALQVPIEDIPVGSRLEISITKTTEIPLPALTASYYLTPSSWPVLEEAQQILAQANPQAAQAFNAVLPNAASPSQLGTTALFFVAAMRAGDIQGWLGEKATDAIKRAGKSDILSRLGREVSGLTRMSSEAISGDWRAMSIPLAWQNDINKIALYFRSEDERGTNDQNNQGKKTRFVMDLSLSNMGNVQLDGLFSGKENVGRLDLVLRTEQSFSQSMKQQMRTAYKTALEETQITGELSFQDYVENWVRITPDSVKEYNADV